MALPGQPKQSWGELLRDLKTAFKTADGIESDASKADDSDIERMSAEELKNMIRTGREIIGREMTLIKRLTSSPRFFATVISAEKKEDGKEQEVILEHRGELISVAYPEGITITAGDVVELSAKTLQIINHTVLHPFGNSAVVKKIIDTERSEVDIRNNTRIVLNGKLGNTLEVGDRVILNESESVIMENRGKEKNRFAFSRATNVSWNDIGGLAEAKTELIDAIENPFKYPNLYAFYNRKPPKGILLYGPPGCGKTMLVKAAATSLAATHENKGIESGYIYIKGPEVLDKYVGVAEATIRQIFEQARTHKEKNGYPAIIFLDEADALLYERGKGKSSDVERTIVPTFLSEMDGLEDAGAIVILATNRQDTLDPAITRDGRMDRIIKIERPTKESALEIFTLNLKKVPLKDNAEPATLAAYACDEFFSETRVLYEGTNENQKIKFTLAHIVNGAMIAGVVDRAAAIAMRRDMKDNTENGVTKNDLREAIDRTFEEKKGLNHREAFLEYVYGLEKQNTLKQATDG